jgi:hypothetical protein
MEQSLAIPAIASGDRTTRVPDFDSTHCHLTERRLRPKYSSTDEPRRSGTVVGYLETTRLELATTFGQLEGVARKL